MTIPTLSVQAGAGPKRLYRLTCAHGESGAYRGIEHDQAAVIRELCIEHARRYRCGCLQRPAAGAPAFGSTVSRTH